MCSDENLLTKIFLPFHFFVLIAGLVLILLKSSYCKILGIFLIISFSGLSYLHTQWIHKPTDIRILLKGKEKLNAYVQGEIVSYPIVVKSTEEQKYLWRSVVQVKKICWDKNKPYIPARGKIRITVNEELNSKFTVGTIAEFYGQIDLPQEPLLSTDFDYRKYLANQEIYFIQRVRFSTDCQSYGRAFGIISSLKYLSAKFHAYISKTLSYGFSQHDENQAVIKAITLGDRADLLFETKEQFRQSGTSHLFSVSGLHVAIVATIISFSLSLTMLPKSIAHIITLGGIWFYAFVTGASAPTLRASLMITAFLCGTFFWRPTISLNSIGLAGTVILLFSPLQALEASFQLSFTVVLALLLFLPTFQNFLVDTKLFPKKDAFLAETLEPIFTKIRRWLCTLFILTLLTSFCAWIGAIPITIHYYKFFSLGTVFINFCVVNLALPVLSLSFLSCVLGVLSITASTLVNVLLNKISLLMQFFCTEGNNLFGIVEVNRSWSIFVWILFYVGLLLFFSGFLFKKRNILFLFLYVLLFAASIYCAPQTNSSPTWNMTFLPANDGSAIVIHNYLKNKTILIDTGDQRVAQRNVLPYLQHQHWDTNPTDIVLTHGDAKHIAGLDTLSNKLNINKIYINGLKSRSPYLKRYSDYPNAYTFWKGDSIEIENTSSNFVQIKVLHPDPNDQNFKKADQGCVVLQLESNGNKILFAGDLDYEGQQLLMDRFSKEDLQSDVLVIGESSSDWWFRTGFLTTINPKKVFINASTHHSVDNFRKESPLGNNTEIFLIDRIRTFDY